MPHINQQTKTEKKIACNYAKCHTRIHRHLIATNNNAGDKNHSHVRAWVSTFRVPEHGNNWPFAVGERGCWRFGMAQNRIESHRMEYGMEWCCGWRAMPSADPRWNSICQQQILDLIWGWFCGSTLKTAVTTLHRIHPHRCSRSGALAKMFCANEKFISKLNKLLNYMDKLYTEVFWNFCCFRSLMFSFFVDNRLKIEIGCFYLNFFNIIWKLL